jgi:hypothetical protein
MMLILMDERKQQQIEPAEKRLRSQPVDATLACSLLVSISTKFRPRRAALHLGMESVRVFTHAGRVI